MRITFIISSLSAGGAERIMSVMANYWADKDWGITLVTLDSVTSDFYKLHPDIKRIAMGLMGESSNPLIAIKNNLIRIVRLRHEIRSSKPDAIISFMDRMNVLTLLATRGLGLNVIISERVDPTYYHIGKLWSLLRRVTYPWANMLVAQTDKIGGWIEKHIAPKKVAVIPNPISYPDEKKYSEIPLISLIGETKPVHFIVAMGRLTPQKGFDLLLKAFAKVARSNPEWKLIIFGEGKERDALLQLADRLGIAKSVFLPGIVKNPMTFLRQADLFVMSSRYEGFPNALLEAMACGLPVVSFDCPSGPREIISDGVDGVLAPPENVDALSETISRLISDERERKRLAARATEVLERFGLEKVMGMWEDIIKNAIHK